MSLKETTPQTSRKWLTVAIFRKWQDSSVALWIEIAVILDWTIMNYHRGGGGHDWHG